jgi:hypothetical protein
MTEAGRSQGLQARKTGEKNPKDGALGFGYKHHAANGEIGNSKKGSGPQHKNDHCDDRISFAASRVNN